MPPSRIEVLTSEKNALFKEIRRAGVRGTVTEDGCAIAEGFHLLDEAIRSERPIRAVIASEPVAEIAGQRLPQASTARLIAVSEPLFRSIATTESSQGVLALVRPPVWSLDDVLAGKALALVLDGVQDPGNAGAMIRAAEAFGATGVVLLRGCVDPYNPKALRASAGSVFRLPLVAGASAELVRASIEQRGITLYAADARGECDLPDTDLDEPVAFLIGGEGRGLSQEIASSVTGLRIPTRDVESLNAAMAAGVLLYEARRQRSLA